MRPSMWAFSPVSDANKKERNGRKKGGGRKKKHDFSTHFYYLSLLFIRRLRKICLLPVTWLEKDTVLSLSTSAQHPFSLPLLTALHSPAPLGPCYPSELLKLLLERHSRQIWMLHKAKPAWVSSNCTLCSSKHSFVDIVSREKQSTGLHLIPSCVAVLHHYICFTPFITDIIRCFRAYNPPQAE